jgi:hypothetical protein
MGKKSAGHYRLCEGFSYAGASFHLFIVTRENGDPAQFVPSSFMDAYYSDAFCPSRDE